MFILLECGLYTRYIVMLRACNIYYLRTQMHTHSKKYSVPTTYVADTRHKTIKLQNAILCNKSSSYLAVMEAML